MKYFSTFYTHSGAIKFSRFLNKNNISNDKSPVPRKLSSNCGIGVSFVYEGDVKGILSDDIERIYTVLDDVYDLFIDFDES